jgi:hypothetical protein
MSMEGHNATSYGREILNAYQKVGTRLLLCVFRMTHCLSLTAPQILIWAQN